MKELVSQVLNSNEGKKELKAAWANAREHGFTEDKFIAYIDKQAEMLDESQRLNFIRWPIMNATVHENPVIHGSYEAEVENVKQYVRERISWIDHKIGYVFVPSEAVVNIEQPDIVWTNPYRVYSVIGQYAGNDISALPKGVYIVSQEQIVQKIIIP